MNKKSKEFLKSVLYIIFFIGLAILTWCLVANYNEKVANSDSDDQSSSTEHILLGSKNEGFNTELKGNVVLTIIFLDDSESKWTENDMNKFKDDQNVATGLLLKEASRYGVDLKITTNYLCTQIKETCTRENYYTLIDSVLKSAGLVAKDKVNNYLNKLYNTDESPIMIALNRKDRPFAVSATANTSKFELGILYQQNGDYRHELLHMYGAEDFYYPDELNELAETLFPNSVMLTSANTTVDELTAYLIGWEDSLSEDAQQAINETKWMTFSYVDSAREENLFTGYGSIDYEDCTYTGDLINGIPYGKGRIVYNNGDIYEGNFEYGNESGYGKYYWADTGDTYEGEFEDGMIHGKGRMVYNNGDIYEGEFEEGIIHGWGVFSSADGYTKEGNWENNKFIGN